MKSLKSMIKINLNIVLVHTVIGVLIGILIIHPITMVIYWFEFHPSAISFELFSEVFLARIKHSFRIQMLPMSLIFSFLGGVFGFVSGLYSKALKHRKILMAKNQELMELDKIKSNFLQLISHEIRTPLNGIVGSVELLKDISATKELAEIVELLEKSVIRLENFSITALKITELRTYSVKLKKQKINLKAEVEERISKLHSKIEPKHIKIIFLPNSNEEPVYVHIDIGLFGFCLDHILENAVDFCTSKIEINIKRDTNPYLTICEIIDDGDGFSDIALNNLFSLFDTGMDHIDETTGLSFPLIKLICEHHNGRLEACNQVNGGAKVSFYLPVLIK